jgi:hypothetical protein
MVCRTSAAAAVLYNPGAASPVDMVRTQLACLDVRTRVWIDETYRFHPFLWTHICLGDILTKIYNSRLVLVDLWPSVKNCATKIYNAQFPLKDFAQ